MKNTRTRKKCTSDEILEHIDIEADIEKIKNKIPNILSSVQNGDTIVTKYSCNCCGKEDSIEKTIKTENHSHKIVTPTKCRYCNNTFEKNYSYVLSNSTPTFRVTSDNVAMVYHNGIHSYNPVIIRAESLRYSALKEYLGISDSNPGLKNIDRYIKEYQANPVLEQATKAGLSYEYLSCGVFDKNKTNLLDSLRLTKYFYTMFNKLCPLNTETLSRSMCVFAGLKCLSGKTTRFLKVWNLLQTLILSSILCLDAKMD